MTQRIYALTLLVGLAGVVSSAAPEPSACSFEVVVKSPTGIPVSSSPVVWTSDSPGFEYRNTTNEFGVARLCDPPIKVRLSIRVGYSACAVTIQGLLPVWGRVRRIPVTFPDCRSQEMIGFCHILLRVKDVQDQPLSGVTLELQPYIPTIQGSFITDDYGRMFLSVAWRVTGKGVLRRNGYVDQAVGLECDPKSSVSEKSETLIRERQ